MNIIILLVLLSYLNLILDDVLFRYCYLFIIVFIVMDVNRMYI